MFFYKYCSLLALTLTWFLYTSYPNLLKFGLAVNYCISCSCMNTIKTRLKNKLSYLLFCTFMSIIIIRPVDVSRPEKTPAISSNDFRYQCSKRLRVVVKRTVYSDRRLKQPLICYRDDLQIALSISLRRGDSL